MGCTVGKPGAAVASAQTMETAPARRRVGVGDEDLEGRIVELGERDTLRSATRHAPRYAPPAQTTGRGALRERCSMGRLILDGELDVTLDGVRWGEDDGGIKRGSQSPLWVGNQSPLTFSRRRSLSVGNRAQAKEERLWSVASRALLPPPVQRRSVRWGM